MGCKFHPTFIIATGTLLFGFACKTTPQGAIPQLLHPGDNASVPLINPNWKEIIKTRCEQSKVPNGVNPDNLAHPLPVMLRWKNGDNCTLEISHEKTFANIIASFPVKDKNELAVYNLESGTIYFWRVKSANGTSRIRSFLTKNDPRLIYISDACALKWPTKGFGPVNIRDFGGKPIVGGGRTRQSLAYRGTEIDNVYTLSPKTLELFRNELKIKTDLDFRYPSNVAGRKQSALGADIQWIHIPINAYNSFTPEQNNYFRDAIRVFADKKNYPIYFHCTGGVDRTGEIAFLLNAILDVEPEENFLDYEISSLSWFPRKRTIPYFAEWQAQIASFGKPDDSWRIKVANYLKSIGITNAEIESIRNIFIEKH